MVDMVPEALMAKNGANWSNKIRRSQFIKARSSRFEYKVVFSCCSEQRSSSGSSRCARAISIWRQVVASCLSDELGKSLLELVM